MADNNSTTLHAEQRTTIKLSNSIQRQGWGREAVDIATRYMIDHIIEDAPSFHQVIIRGLGFEQQLWVLKEWKIQSIWDELEKLYYNRFFSFDREGRHLSLGGEKMDLEKSFGELDGFEDGILSFYVVPADFWERSSDLGGSSAWSVGDQTINVMMSVPVKAYNILKSNSFNVDPSDLVTATQTISEALSDSPEYFRIIVGTIDAICMFSEVWVAASWPAGKIWDMLAQAHGVCRGDCHLALAGEKVDPDKTIADLGNVEEGTTFWLVPAAYWERYD